MWEENPCTMLIRRLYLSLTRLSNRILHQHDLTMSQLMTLLLLSGSSEKELSLKELERLLQTSQPDVAGIASRLEKKGLVSRFQDAADRRVKRLSITTQGEQSCCAARGEIRSGEDALRQPIPKKRRHIRSHNRLCRPFFIQYGCLFLRSPAGRSSVRDCGRSFQSRYR